MLSEAEYAVFWAQASIADGIGYLLNRSYYYKGLHNDFSLSDYAQHTSRLPDGLQILV